MLHINSLTSFIICRFFWKFMAKWNGNLNKLCSCADRLHRPPSCTPDGWICLQPKRSCSQFVWGSEVHPSSSVHYLPSSRPRRSCPSVHHQIRSLIQVWPSEAHSPTIRISVPDLLYCTGWQRNSHPSAHEPPAPSHKLVVCCVPVFPEK